MYALAYILHGIPQIDGAFIYLALIIICQLRVFYYVFCLEILNWQFQMIQHELIIMKQRSPNIVDIVGGASNSVLQSRAHKANNFFDLNRMKWVNEYYGCIVEMTKLLNIIFGWSQFASILFKFYSLLTDLNWCYVSFNFFPTLKYLGK